jgi:hypothetical protein
VFEDRMLRRIFGPRTWKVTGGWKKQHDEELHNLYASKYIIQVIKSRRMRSVRHVAHVEGVNAYKVLAENLKGREHLEDLWVDGKILLEWILGKQGGEVVDWIRLAQYRDQWLALVNTVTKLRFP